MVPFVFVRDRFAVSTPAEEPPGRLRCHTVQPVRPGEERSHAGVAFEEVYVSNDGELGVGLVADQVPKGKSQECDREVFQPSSRCGPEHTVKCEESERDHDERHEPCG